MRNRITCSVAFIGFACLLSCKEEGPKCTTAQRIAVQSECYDPARGLTLVALGLNDNYSNLRWEIHVLDNLSNGWTPDDIEINLGGGESFVIPDSLVLDHIHIMARVITDCPDNQLYSKDFSFVKVKSATCTNWIEAEI